MWRYVFALALLAAPLSGCLNADDNAVAADDERITRTRAVVEEGFGAIEGVITDNAVQPVPDATVTLVELERTTTVDQTGGYAFNQVPPGTYTLQVTKAGFVPAIDTADVSREEVAVVDFILIHLASELPYMQTLENAGFMEYGWGVGHNATGDSFWIRDTNCDYDEIAGPNCRGEFELDPPLETIVFEMVWAAAGPLAEKLQPMLRVSDNAAVITGEYEFFSLEGASPLVARMDRADLDAVLAGFAERCDGGEEQFCGMGFRDEGWPLQTRVWPSWQCPTEQAGFCALIEQDYTQFLTAFYNAPAPPGFTAIGELPTAAAAPRASHDDEDAVPLPSVGLPRVS